MKTMKLTPLGEIANRHSVLTPLTFWKNLLQEIRRIEDRDGDWEVMVDERIKGLEAVRQYVREHGTGV
jgi:hypothetical protein